MSIYLTLLAVLGLGACSFSVRGRYRKRLAEVPHARSEGAPAGERQSLRAVSKAGTSGRERPSVSVVIPALNEAESLPWVLETLPAWVAEVILVDGLSTDGTELVARRVRPDIVVVQQLARGKGAALRAGFAAATGDIVVMMDADGSTDPREMERFVDALLDGGDLVKGSRNIGSGGSADFTRVRSLGNRAFVLLANLLYGSRFTDLCYGYCAFWRHHLGVLGLTADGFEIESELVLGAVRGGLEVCEVPSYELERRAGTSNLSAVRDGTRVLRTILSMRVSRSPTRPVLPATISLVPIQGQGPDELTLHDSLLAGGAPEVLALRQRVA